MSRIEISRRVFVGGALTAVTALTLSGCLDPAADVMVVDQDGQFFSAHELTILAEVAEIMIPRTDTPGALDAEVAPVVDAMMLSWAVDRTRQQFRDALKAFDEKADQLAGSYFAELPKPDRIAIVTELDEVAFGDNAEAAEFENYRRLKELIFRIFYTSEAASSQFVPIPGRYEGNLSLEEYDGLVKERSLGG